MGPVVRNRQGVCAPLGLIRVTGSYYRPHQDAQLELAPHLPSGF